MSKQPNRPAEGARPLGSCGTEKSGSAGEVVSPQENRIDEAGEPGGNRA